MIEGVRAGEDVAGNRSPSNCRRRNGPWQLSLLSDEIFYKKRKATVEGQSSTPLPVLQKIQRPSNG